MVSKALEKFRQAMSAAHLTSAEQVTWVTCKSSAAVRYLKEYKVQQDRLVH